MVGKGWVGTLWMEINVGLMAYVSEGIEGVVVGRIAAEGSARVDGLGTDVDPGPGSASGTLVL